MRKVLEKLGFVTDETKHNHDLQASWALELELLAEGRREEAEKVRLSRWDNLYKV